MRVVRRQWSDQVKIQDEPPFACCPFCRLSRAETLHAVKTAGVFDFYRREGQPFPIAEEDIRILKVISNPDLDAEETQLPILGTSVVVRIDTELHGILVERGPICRVALSFNSLGRRVIVKVPLNYVIVKEA
jgi:hypothetical protein